LEAFGNLGIGTVLSFIYGWELALVIIGFLPFIIIGGVINVKLVDKFSKKDSKASKVRQINYAVENNIH
jgi:ABC-type bacteriocin/lantibiotic exporter with double-glycine peptidase domain